ncbi:hypothetical protein I5Q01_02610 [Serratia ureilytica]|uniref:hypothetical protein n=2 Tax=Serratia TaxID=613 RepID=UPI0018D6B3CE|nr:hypothetical protein [Serratia ureilytica]MBH3059266.1 hypothetical protein [Serratia ureilytica]
MSDDELKIFLFAQTCVILSGVLAAREGQPLIIQQRFSKVYELLAQEYEKLTKQTILCVFWFIFTSWRCFFILSMAFND